MMTRRYVGVADGIPVKLTEVAIGVVRIDPECKDEGSEFDLEGTPKNTLAILKGYRLTGLALIPPHNVQVIDCEVDFSSLRDY